MMERRV